MFFHELSIGLQNGDVSVSNTNTPRILADTYPLSIRLTYFNFKKIFHRIIYRNIRIFMRYFIDVYPRKNKG